MSLDELIVFVDAPPHFLPRAVWVLDTLLAQAGRRVAVTSDVRRAGEACLAYATSPVSGVPTLPCSAEAMALFAAGRALPPGSFAVRQRDGGAVGAFAVESADGYAVSFDLVAAAFALLVCWDERTTDERDPSGRLPFSASVFAANPALKITEPAVDSYVDLLRFRACATAPGARARPSAPKWLDLGERAAGGRRGRSRVSASLSRSRTTSTTCGAGPLAASPRRLPQRQSGPARRWGGLCAANSAIFGDWLIRHLPQRTDPFWTFPQILGGEDARGVRSTFYVIARHTHPRDGNQPATYRRRVPAALALLRDHRCEVGLHGNDGDRLAPQALAHDRELLERGGGAEVCGIRYHWLRCLYHETLPLLEQAGFSYDTSLAFAEHEGFRCGCSFPFRPYHLGEERPLDLVELPLAVMDGTLQQSHYRGLPADKAEQAARDVLERAARGGGAVSILWHNSRFDRRVARGYDGVYWRLLDGTIAAGGWAAPAGEIVARWREATGVSAPVRPARAHEGAGAGRRLNRTKRESGTRVLHLSVVHKPDDPRIHERECRSLAAAGYEVAYLAPGADRGVDESGVLLCPLPQRRRATRFLDSVEIVQALRALRPHVLHVHDPELLTLFPALRAFIPRLVYDMHEYVPEAVAGKPYIPARVRPSAARATAVAQRGLAAFADGVVVVTDEQLAALGSTTQLRLVLPNYPCLERFDRTAPVPELAADPRLKLIYVGSLSRARGCTMMLDVMEHLSCRGRGALPRWHVQRSSARDRGPGAPRSRPRRPRAPSGASSPGGTCRATSPPPTSCGWRRFQTGSTRIPRSPPSCLRAWPCAAPRWSATCRVAVNWCGGRRVASRCLPDWTVT